MWDLGVSFVECGSPAPAFASNSTLVPNHQRQPCCRHLNPGLPGCRVPHPFTPFVKGAQGDHNNQRKHLHLRSNAKGAPGSDVWNLGLGFSCLSYRVPHPFTHFVKGAQGDRNNQRKPLHALCKKDRCHPEERLFAKREARRRTRRRISTFASCLPSPHQDSGRPVHSLIR
jgi:hypothetical protein